MPHKYCTSYDHVVQIGLGKSGTSTIAAFFKHLGYNDSCFYRSDVATHPVFPLEAAVERCPHMYVGELAAVYFPQDNFQLQLTHMRTIQTRMRNTLFVHCQRNTTKWTQSVLHWNTLAQRYTQRDMPGLPAGYGGRRGELADWYDGVNAFLRFSFRHTRNYVNVDVDNLGSLQALASRCNVSNYSFGVHNAGRYRQGRSLQALPRYSTADVVRQLCPRPGKWHSGCTTAPDTEDIEACTRALERKHLWPSVSALSAAVAFYSKINIVFVGDSTIYNKHRYLHEVWALAEQCNGASDAPGVCMRRMYNRSCPLPHTLQPAVDVVVFGWGLGSLHLHPVRTAVPPNVDVAAHHLWLKDCVRDLSAAYPNAVVVLKLTNHVCQQRFRPPYDVAARRWNPRNDVVPLSALAHPTDSKYLMQFTSVGTQTLNALEDDVQTFAPKTLLADSQTSGETCACTGLGDGRHYAPLVPQFLVSLAAALQRV